MLEKISTSRLQNRAQRMRCVSEWIKDIVGKPEDDGYKYFLLFPSMFLNA